jgi:hypothetical protein
MHSSASLVAFFPVNACVLGCTCRDKPSWRGQPMCARVDNQQSRGVVNARLRSFVRSLLHQRRDLHQSTYLYLTEDREPTSHRRPQNACLIFEEKGDAPMQWMSHIWGEGRSAHATRVSFLLNMHKKDIYRLFSMRFPLRQYAACPLAYIGGRMCPNGHPVGPAQETPCGAQAVWHHQSH